VKTFLPVFLIAFLLLMLVRAGLRSTTHLASFSPR